MLTELCKELNNWFEKSIVRGSFSISNGVVTLTSAGKFPVQENQYIRINGSVFNDGVYKYSSAGIEDLKDEEFIGEVWLMAVPKEVLQLADEIKAWKNKYENIESASMSPYNSESFGGYSYSKNSGSSADGSGGGGANSWTGFFAGVLNRWRKI